MSDTQTKPAVESDVDISELVNPYEDSDDPNLKTHIINGEMNPHIYLPGMRTLDIVQTARLLGKSITALCGFKFVPLHNPEKYDICEACMENAQALIRGE